MTSYRKMKAAFHNLHFSVQLLNGVICCKNHIKFFKAQIAYEGKKFAKTHSGEIGPNIISQGSQWLARREPELLARGRRKNSRI